MSNTSYGPSFMKVSIVFIICILILAGSNQIMNSSSSEYEEVSEETEEMLLNVFTEEFGFYKADMNGTTIYLARNDDNIEEVAVIATVEGYGGEMEVLIATDIDGEVTDIEVLEHSETPDIGDKVEEPDYLDQFSGKTAEDSLEVGEDIDGISQATVSSEAVAEAVRNGLDNIQEFIESGQI
ncbi:MAG: FMN-binding protein [Halanaerobiales bacterium]